MNKNKKSVVFSMNAKLHFKIIVVGDKHAGKTSLILRFVKDMFELNYKVTVGVEFYSKIIQDQEEQIALQIWDTAGSDNYKSVVRSFYNFAHAVLIVYEGLAQISSIANWMRQVREHAQESVVVVLVRTKIEGSPMEAEEQAEVQKIMKQHSISIFMTVSARANTNVNELFTKVGTHLHHLLETDEKFMNMVNHKCESILLQDIDPPHKKNNKCCH